MNIYQRVLSALLLLASMQAGAGESLTAEDDLIADRLEDAGLFVIGRNEILANDATASGLSVEDLTIISVDSAIGGTVFLDSEVRYRTPRDFNGPASFRYTVRAPDGSTSSATVRMNITPVNDPPQFSNRGDILYLIGEVTPPVYANWAFNYTFGAGETDQVADFVVTVLDDPANVITAADVSNFGTLSFDATGNVGTATLQIQLRDAGGTANGGQDLSAPTIILFRVTAVVDLQVSKTNGLDQIRPGSLVTYEIEVSNQGFVDLPEVAVTDIMPEEYRSTFWNCAAFSGARCGAERGDGDINEFVSLPSLSRVVYIVSGVVLGENGTLITNIATATGPEEFVELTPEDNRAIDSDRIGGPLFRSGFEEAERPTFPR